MAKRKRTMPKSGYYVFNSHKYNYHKSEPILTSQKADISDPLVVDIIYVSGTFKGNYYWEPPHHGVQWNQLLWTCVPGIKYLADYYDYYSECPIPIDIPQ